MDGIELLLIEAEHEPEGAVGECLAHALDDTFEDATRRAYLDAALWIFGCNSLLSRGVTHCGQLRLEVLHALLAELNDALATGDTCDIDIRAQHDVLCVVGALFDADLPALAGDLLQLITTRLPLQVDDIYAAVFAARN